MCVCNAQSGSVSCAVCGCEQMQTYVYNKYIVHILLHMINASGVTHFRRRILRSENGISNYSFAKAYIDVCLWFWT